MVGGVVITTPPWGIVPVILLPARAVSNVVAACSRFWVVVLLALAVAVSVVSLAPPHAAATVAASRQMSTHRKVCFMLFCVVTALKRSEWGGERSNSSRLP